MIIFKKSEELLAFIIRKKNENKKVGFVPTMGALHDGHISLIASANSRNDLTVVSIFVNPTQFTNAADFEKYPKTIEEDINKLEAAECDVLFLPDVDEVYPNPIKQAVYEIGFLENILEGKFRPGHYQGVCQVVHRLLDIVRPDDLYLGQKDFQQCLVLKKMIRDADLPVSVHIVETMREKDGLAMSSRNLRLTDAQRKVANSIFKAMQKVKDDMEAGDLSQVKKLGARYLTEHDFKVDYLEIADPDDLTVMHSWDGKKSYVILAAAYLGDIRLIDNLLVEEKSN
jgi:pantoate--beta-alanine ligase